MHVDIGYTSHHYLDTEIHELRFMYTDTHRCYTGTRLDQYTDYRISYHVMFTYHGYTYMSGLHITAIRVCHVYLSRLHVHVMFTYHCYTCMSCLHIIVTPACYVYISLLHMHVMFP